MNKNLKTGFNYKKSEFEKGRIVGGSAEKCISSLKGHNEDYKPSAACYSNHSNCKNDLNG